MLRFGKGLEFEGCLSSIFDAMTQRSQGYAKKNMTRNRKLSLFLLPVLILIIGFGLRIYALDDFNMNWDEGYSNWIVHLPFGEMIETTARDVHPPFYYLLLRFNNVVNGDGEFVMRLPSVLLGMLGIALTFALGRQVGGYWVGVLAMLLLAVIRANVDIAQLMRMHVLAMVFSTAGMWAALRFWQKPSRRGAALIYVLCAAGSLYSFLFGVGFPTGGEHGLSGCLVPSQF